MPGVGGDLLGAVATPTSGRARARADRGPARVRAPGRGRACLDRGVRSRGGGAGGPRRAPGFGPRQSGRLRHRAGPAARRRARGGGRRSGPQPSRARSPPASPVRSWRTLRLRGAGPWQGGGGGRGPHRRGLRLAGPVDGEQRRPAVGRPLRRLPRRLALSGLDHRPVRPAGMGQPRLAQGRRGRVGGGRGGPRPGVRPRGRAGGGRGRRGRRAAREPALGAGGR